MSSNTALPAGSTNYNSYTAARPAVLGLARVAFLGLCQLSYVSAAPVKTFLGLTKHDEEPPADVDDPSLWFNLGLAAVLVLLGGAFAGLTIALMGQDGVYLQVIATSGEGKEQRHAKSVYRLLQRGKHWVLVTLLLSNVIVNETLPIVLDRSLGGGWPAVLGSTVLIVIFGEVIPQSVCVRYGLSIGAFMAPAVLALMWILAPIAWPTAKLLDKMLGEDHGTVYKKSGLKTLVTLHKTLGTSPGDRLNQDEVTIISAVLDLKEKSVGDIMTPMEDVFTMSADTVLDEKTMDTILTAGYSRIPIYEPGKENNFVGMLLVKILITYDPEDCKRVSEFALATLPETRPETSCLDIVNFFQEGKSHMVLVSEFPGDDYGAVGVVTLEDVIEELIGEEIIDESDVYIDVHKAIRRMAPAPKARVPRGHIVANPDNAALRASEDHLIDLREEQAGTPDAVDTSAKLRANGANGANGDSRSVTPATLSSSPKTTFVRRASSGLDGKNIAVRGNLNDMREHLKHLGPSNLASRPKQTRYNTVKIKPGHVPIRANSTAGSALHRYSISEEPYRDEPPYKDVAPEGGEGEGLLKSAGIEAKDGVQAVQQGYGSIPKSPPTKQDGSSSDPPKSPGSHRSRTPTPPRSEHDDSRGSSDTLGSLQSHGSSSNLPRKRGAARSGSITENIIDAGGVRKVVLETNSTSSDENEVRAQDEGAFPSPNKGSPEIASHTDGHGSEAEGPPKGGSKKKQKRRKKKKGSKNGESSTGGT